ncbi:hypothetical protein G7Y89_g2866 [Cudoniella acicularis]|uniref:Tat pathway signal sequence n=1 Tax=Cudoniella acicularis TaxID=354080 RepID=A0A8H4RSH2_9HELO|nr:hypothetical protein G7Y89_g2866 [Cudoniella acicularis]
MAAQFKNILASAYLLTTRTKFLRSLKGYKFVDADLEDYQDQESAKSKLLRCSQCDNRLPNTPPKNFHVLYSTYAGWALSGILTVILTTVLILGDGNRWQQNCFGVTSSYSPLLSQVPNTLSETIRNGSIRWPSPYRVRPLNIKLTEEEYRKIGKSPETAAKNPSEFGGGYFLQPEFSHQLHCINLLRKASHFKYSYYLAHDPDFKDKPATFKVHFDHCVEMLRQFVMCHADVGLVTAHWIEQRGRPWPDFNTKQTCRNFEGIWQWTVDHQMPEGTPMIPTKPAGAKALSSPP